MSQITIRHATTDDVQGIQRIARLGWTAAYGEFLSNEVIDRVMDEWYDSEIIRQAIADERVSYFVARTSEEDDDADDVMGYASGGVSETAEDGGSVRTLYVHPDRWGEGIGTRLFEAVLDSLHEWGTERAEVHVLAENTVGISFYESQGFERVREGESEFGGSTEPHREYVYADDL